MDLHPQDWSPRGSGASTDFTQALRLHAGGRTVEAEAAYRAILARDAEHARALGMLALILADCAEPAAAEAALRRHLELEPLSASSLLALGRLRASAGDDREAADLLARAAEARPDLAP
ncbi:MAG: hypothetical protein JSS35_17455, partial [Proteobacteria bacterium]|nr:hypothetical protein [Pseudomonadota bacterium]